MQKDGKREQLLGDKQKLDEAIKKIMVLISESLDRPDMLTSPSLIAQVDKAVVDIKSALGDFYAFSGENKEKRWIARIMDNVTRWHVGYFGVYSNRLARPSRESAETLLTITRALLPQVATVGVDPVTLDLRVPEVRVKKTLSDHIVDIAIGIVIAVIAWIVIQLLGLRFG